MKFKFTARQKVGLVHKAWNLDRERLNYLKVEGQADRYVIGTRLLEGDINYFAQAYNAAYEYVRNIRPELINNTTYEDLYIAFNLATPKDTGIMMLPYEGFVDILERKGGYYLTVNPAGDVVATNISANSRVYFNCIIRMGVDSIATSSVIDHIIGDLFWRSYVNAAFNIILNDLFAANLTNRQLMRNCEIQSYAIRMRQYLGEQNLAVDDVKRIPKLREFTDKFVETVVKPYMNRKYLNFPMLRHKVGALNWYTTEDIAEAFMQRLLTVLPDKDWMNVYSLNGIVPFGKEYSLTNFRDAIGAGQKFVLSLYPPTERLMTGNIPGYNGYTARTVGAGTPVTHTVIQSEEFFSMPPNNFANVTYGNQGVYQAAAVPGVPIDEAALMNHIATYPIGPRALQPQIQVAIGKDTPSDKCTLLVNPAIVPPTNLVLRVLSAMEDKQGLPTFVDLVWPVGGGVTTYKCLILPETGINMKATSRISRARQLLAKTEECSFEGQYHYQFIDTLRNLAPQDFEWGKPQVLTTETCTLSELIGV